MIIAREKKNQNIIEYILYMWQLEDLIRAFNLDMNKISINIVEKYQQPDSVKKEINDWYENHIQMMIAENCQEKGHLAYLANLVNDLENNHQQLLTSGIEKSYISSFSVAREVVNDLKKKAGQNKLGDVEAGLNGLYGFLVLKLQKKEISKGTSDAIKNLSEWMAHLADLYNKV